MSANEMFEKLAYYQIRSDDGASLVYENSTDDEDAIAQIRLYADGGVSKMYYLKDTETWIAASLISREELDAIFQLHKDLRI